MQRTKADPDVLEVIENKRLHGGMFYYCKRIYQTYVFLLCLLDRAVAHDALFGVSSTVLCCIRCCRISLNLLDNRVYKNGHFGAPDSSVFFRYPAIGTIQQYSIADSDKSRTDDQ